MAKKRKTNRRKINKRVLILCEGKKTEPNYFKAIKSDRSKVNQFAALRIQIFDTEKNTAVELVEEAKRLKEIAKCEFNDYDSIWVVFDKDGYTKHAQAFHEAKTKNINIAFSSISFEYWYLLHFELTSKPFYKAEELIKHLIKHHISDYRKNRNYYPILKEKTEQATVNAKQLVNQKQIDLERGTHQIWDLNPYTNVYELVEYLLNL